MTLAPHVPDLQELLDTHALQQLAWTYCHAVDRGDLTLLRSLYHDDAIDDHGSMFCGTPDEYVAWLPRMLAGLDATRHEITNMLFVIDGDTAQGQLHSTAYHRTPRPDSREIVIGGRYLDTYAKRGGIWRILRRSLVMDTLLDRPASVAGGFIGEGVDWGTSDAGDPVFSRLERFRA
jgi:ketosteroid isomerase-like protein